MRFLVLYSRKDAIWKIGDFGFTSVGSSQSIRYSSNARGTPGYRAPELLQGERGSFNNKADIWAMGCILFELAAGKKAFENDEIVHSWWLSGEQFTLILEDRTLDENANYTISNIVNRMIDRNSALRPSASILLEDICNIENAANESSLQSEEFISEGVFTVASSQQDIPGNIHAIDDHAIQECQSAVDKEPLNYWLWHDLSRLYVAKNDINGAIQACLLGIEKSATNPSPLMELSNLYAANGDYKSAILASMKLSTFNPLLLQLALKGSGTPWRLDYETKLKRLLER
jgi:serine/threonine protein kinase